MSTTAGTARATCSGTGSVKGGPPASDYRRFSAWEGIGEKQWGDWRWQARNLIRTLDGLGDLLSLSPGTRATLEETVREYHLSLTPYYASLIDPVDPDDPIRLQAVPQPDECFHHGHEKIDPLAEEQTSPVPGLTHRYPDRVLLVTTNFCYMYCRHCTRKRIWKDDEGAAGRKTIDLMVRYIRRHPQIRDALVSGGDPLTLPLDQLDYILSQLRSIDHLEIIRVGSRVPVVMPMGITEDLVGVLEKHGPLWLNTQFNHPREVTPEAAAAIDRFLRAGIPVNNQSVLLRGVNDNPETMFSLNQALLMAKIRPYYLFQCDPVIGADHFRTPVAAGMEIMEALRGHTSGLAIPSYVIDLPGGGGKVPVTPNYVVGRTDEGIVLRNFEGRTFTYPDTSAAVPSAGRRALNLSLSSA
jgi:lysine 2,3-aminomutase